VEELGARGRRRAAAAARGALEKVCGQRFDLLGPLAERRDLDGEGDEPLARVPAERTRHVGDRPLAGGDHAWRASPRQVAEEVERRLAVELVDADQDQRNGPGLLDEPGAVEGAGETLAVGDLAAVDDDGQRPGRPAGGDRLSEEALSGAGLAADQ